MKSHRLARVSEVVREVAASTVLFELKDPRVKNVTVTRAEVSADLQHAKVYVSVMGTEKEQQLTMHGLRAAAGFVDGLTSVTQFLPGAASDALVGASLFTTAASGVSAEDQLAWWAGGLVLLAYAVVLLVLGYLTSWRRDVT